MAQAVFSGKAHVQSDCLYFKPCGSGRINIAEAKVKEGTGH